MKTCSLLVKMVSDWENDFMQKKCNKWMTYINILPSHKNTTLRSWTIHLVGVDMIAIANSILIIETYFYMIWKRAILAYLQLKHKGVYLHCLVMRFKFKKPSGFIKCLNIL